MAWNVLVAGSNLPPDPTTSLQSRASWSVLLSFPLFTADLILLAKAGEGIRSNVVSPGPIFVEGGAWDGIKQNHFDLYERDRLDHPSQRLGTPEEVANVAVFVSSPAASWMNGANVVVDGGFTKGVGF